MTSLLDDQPDDLIKLLLLGDSGAGKTGALASLALAGYSLRIVDMDNGTDILKNLLTKRGSPKYNPEAAGRIHRQIFTDQMQFAGTNLVPKSAQAWGKLVSSLNKWDDGTSIEKLGPQDVFVVDSLNFAGKAAMRHIQQLNNRLAVPPQIQDFRDGQLLIENLCATLFSTSIRCNVLCLSHVRELGKTQDIVDDKGRVRVVEIPETVKGFPETGTGRALSPTIGRYFNSVLLADIKGSGLSTTRIIRTQPHQNIGLKNSAPGLVKAEYPLETGLADYFETIRGPLKKEEKKPAATIHDGITRHM